MPTAAATPAAPAATAGRMESSTIDTAKACLGLELRSARAGPVLLEANGREGVEKAVVCTTNANAAMYLSQNMFERGEFSKEVFS
mmetsp:Transcript_4875/g.9660  ORF Transcript_4875/g.9660 Transcript_4875/m.9660 type:complete len:85 (-) Transcript_4875:33-287(-)